MTAAITTNSLANWFGSNRLLAREVGKQLAGCPFVAVPFAGGMSELLHIPARSLIVNDRHAAVINMSRVAADPVLGPKFYRALKRKAYHPDELKAAQGRCAQREESRTDSLFCAASGPDAQAAPSFDWAADYFVCCWQARGGDAGTDNEFDSSFSIRWDAGGGDSAVRYRSAVNSLIGWRSVLSRCTFWCEDFRDFITRRVKDRKGHGLYVDAPWADKGEAYKHPFTERDQRDLATMLARYTETRVVVRFGVHPLIEELYPEPQWTWIRQTSRSQANKDVAEALIVRN